MADMGKSWMIRRSNRIIVAMLLMLGFSIVQPAFGQSLPDSMEILEIQVGPRMFYIQRAWMGTQRQRDDGSVIPYDQVEGQRCIAVMLQPNRPDLPEQRRKWAAMGGDIQVSRIEICPDPRKYRKSFQEMYPKNNWPLFPELMTEQIEIPYCGSNHTSADYTGPLYCHVVRRGGEGIFIKYVWDEKMVSPAEWMKTDFQVQRFIDWLITKPQTRSPTAFH
jgi:hypothetical protein